jgi:hypothetical protein
VHSIDEFVLAVVKRAFSRRTYGIDSIIIFIEIRCEPSQPQSNILKLQIIMGYGGRNAIDAVDIL